MKSSNFAFVTLFEISWPCLRAKEPAEARDRIVEDFLYLPKTENGQDAHSRAKAGIVVSDQIRVVNSQPLPSGSSIRESHCETGSVV
jgi:hypothetical protein